MHRFNSTHLILFLTVLAMVAGGCFWLLDQQTATNASFVVAAIIPLYSLVSEIIERIRARRPGVDVIALLAVVGAIILGEYLAAAIVGLMLATGQYLEEYAAGRAERELTSLVKRAPKFAHRLVDRELETLDVDEIAAGDRLLVKAGEVVPVDGVVTGTAALVDESALTGEPLPVPRQSGDLISSGAINAGDPFELRATATADESTYAGIIRLVEESRSAKAPSIRLADRWAGWFVPFTLLVAGLAWAVSGDPIRALAVLVVATPCPLILAVPIAIVSGVSRGARRGIVFRGGGALEMLAQTKNVIIDKTGTVTVGLPALHSIVSFDGASEDDILGLAAAVDQTSNHVLARTIVEAARQRSLPLVFPTEVSEETGMGISARVDGRRVAVGRLEWLLAGTAEPDRVASFRRRMSRVAPTAVYVSIDGAVAGAITFDDRIRPDAVNTIRTLRRIGVERIVMATGDHPVVAQSVGSAIDVDEVLAECTPREKVEAIEELRARGVTAMVGDGINDAPALAAADVGVAMGARGATASSEAADVVLVVDRLQRLVDGIAIAQRSRRVAVESVVIGMGLAMVAMGFAAWGLITPIVGALIQEAIDVVAMANSLRALKVKVPTESGPRLDPELSAQLRVEHDHLIPKLEMLRTAGDRLDLVPAAEAREELERVRSFLVDEILPHEANDEREIYPHLSNVLPGEDPMALMSRGHREIFHLIDVFQTQMGDMAPDGPDPAEIRDLRRTLYGLWAVLRLHFDQEEELYTALQEG